MFYWGKIHLDLCANAPVSVSRVSLLPMGPVSEDSRIIYQNTQNEALSMEQRSVWSKSHPHEKR